MDNLETIATAYGDIDQKIKQLEEQKTALKELGGTMPENLPVAEDIKKLETKRKKELKDKAD